MSAVARLQTQLFTSTAWWVTTAYQWHQGATDWHIVRWRRTMPRCWLADSRRSRCVSVPYIVERPSWDHDQSTSSTHSIRPLPPSDTRSECLDSGSASNSCNRTATVTIASSSRNPVSSHVTVFYRTPSSFSDRCMVSNWHVSEILAFIYELGATWPQTTLTSVVNVKKQYMWLDWNSK